MAVASVRTVDCLPLALVGLVDPAGEVGCVYGAWAVPPVALTVGLVCFPIVGWPPLVGLVASEFLDVVGACDGVAEEVGCVDGGWLMPVVVWDAGPSVGFWLSPEGVGPGAPDSSLPSPPQPFLIS